MFFETHLKPAKKYFKNTISPVQHVRPDLIAIFENASVVMIGTMNN